MAVKKHSHQKWINYWGSRQGHRPYNQLFAIRRSELDHPFTTRYLLHFQLL